MPILKIIFASLLSYVTAAIVAGCMLTLLFFGGIRSELYDWLGGLAITAMITAYVAALPSLLAGTILYFVPRVGWIACGLAGAVVGYGSFLVVFPPKTWALEHVALAWPAAASGAVAGCIFWLVRAVLLRRLDKIWPTGLS